MQINSWKKASKFQPHKKKIWNSRKIQKNIILSDCPRLVSHGVPAWKDKDFIKLFTNLSHKVLFRFRFVTFFSLGKKRLSKETEKPHLTSISLYVWKTVKQAPCSTFQSLMVWSVDPLTTSGARYCKQFTAREWPVKSRTKSYVLVFQTCERIGDDALMIKALVN